MRIEPSKPPSKRPTAWRRVDLPEPEGPRRATISPARTSRSRPRRTLMVTPPCWKLRFSPRTERIAALAVAASLIAQHLDRVGARRLPGRVEGGEEAEEEGHDDDRGDLERIGLGRKLGEEADLRVPEVLAGQHLDEVHDALAEIEEDRAEEQPGEDAEDSDGDADGHEDLEERAAGGAHGPEDGDVAGLGADQHDQRREDVEHGDEDDDREDDEHHHPLDLERLEERAVLGAPVAQERAALEADDERVEDG